MTTPRNPASSDQADEAAKTSEADAASRRWFIQHSSLLLAGGGLGGVKPLQIPHVHASGHARIRLGLVGCGGRGVAAIDQAMLGAVKRWNWSLWAMSLIAVFMRVPKPQRQAWDRIQPQRFVGLDAYQGVINSQADVIYLVTPPGLLPLHFEAAVAANKHVFMEKSVAVDAPGVRRVLAAGEAASAKQLLVQVGLQRRHDKRYQDCIAQIHQGALGRSRLRVPTGMLPACGLGAPKRSDRTRISAKQLVLLHLAIG